MSRLFNKKIGIWGFGIVGKSVARFLISQQVTIEIFDQRVLTDTEMAFVRENNILIATNKHEFLTHNDIIIPSPGVNIDSIYVHYKHKWLCELDLFSSFFAKKIISITGTVGKTSVTKLLSDILTAYGHTIVMGGNIGIACLDLLESEVTAPEYAVLEVSSYQLTHTQTFTPDIAIMTNFSHNHLDWHGSEEAYFKAKCAQFIRQNPHQKALIPFNVKKQIASLYTLPSKQYFFSTIKPSPEEFATLMPHESLFYIDNNMIMLCSYFTPGSHYTYVRLKNISTSPLSPHVYAPLISLSLPPTLYHISTPRHTCIPLISVCQLSRITFDQNWLIICASLYLMGVDIYKLPSLVHRLTIPEHRLEECLTQNGVTVYNDSKGTTIASTRAAVQQLQDRPIILILGGLSKGVDRTPFIAELKKNIKKICTFGAESKQLTQACITYDIPVTACDTLEEVVQASINAACTGDQILFSPAGSSYDQFIDYAHRGTCFKELVNKYKVNLPTT